jgi:hypothetical protein
MWGGGAVIIIISFFYLLHKLSYGRKGGVHIYSTGNTGPVCMVVYSVSDPDPLDPHSIGRLDPDPGGMKRSKMKKKKTQLKDR